MLYVVDNRLDLIGTFLFFIFETIEAANRQKQILDCVYDREKRSVLISEAVEMGFVVTWSRKAKRECSSQGNDSLVTQFSEKIYG